jgi:hypothetical protein
MLQSFITVKEPFQSAPVSPAESLYSAPFLEPFAFSDLCPPPIAINCVVTTSADELLCVMVNGPTIYFVSSKLALTRFCLLVASIIMPSSTTSGLLCELSLNKDGFDGDLTIQEGEQHFGGMASGLQIHGFGPVVQTFCNQDRSELQIRSQAYYVSATNVCLLSPQHLFSNSKGHCGSCHGDKCTFNLTVAASSKTQL